jgi:hypothetical protein
MSQDRNLMWLGGAANSLEQPALFSFGDLDFQLAAGPFRLIDDPSMMGITDNLAEAAEVVAAILDPENAEPIPWERVKRDLKL